MFGSTYMIRIFCFQGLAPDYYPHLKVTTNSKNNDQQLEAPETVRKLLFGNRSQVKSTTAEPLLEYLYKGKSMIVSCQIWLSTIHIHSISNSIKSQINSIPLILFVSRGQ